MAIALSGDTDGNNIAGTSSQVVSENKKTTGEMVGGCSVCSDDQGTEDNPLVYCDGCEVAVHPACYGIVKVPPGNWFCDKCQFGDRHNKIKCELCPSKDGALKKTESGLWAHVVCALYIPEVRFGNNDTMEPIILKFIRPDRYTKKCYLCEEAGNSSMATYGAMIECHKLGCKQSFHVTCAQTANLLCEEAGQGSGNVIYCGYCKQHFRKRAGNRKSSNSLNNSSNSFLDSASDSSQDNDLRCNTTEHDKNSRSTNKNSTLPSNLPTSETIASNSHLSAAISLTPSKTSSKVPKNAPISLTIPPNSPNKTASAAGAASGASSTPQKKKRAPKSLQSSNSGTSNSSTLLATASSLPGSLDTQTSSATSKLTVGVTNKHGSADPSQDVYNWSVSSGDKEQNEKSTAQNNKGNKRKPATTPNTTQPSTKIPAQLNSQPATISGYNTKQVGNLNFSLSTSPSLASPSNSTKSSSNSSSSSTSTATATSSSSSSSSSTSSNSPSPALLSPNISNRGLAATAATAASAIRLESPLASNSRTGNNLHNRSQTDPAPSNITLPMAQSILPTRMNLDNLKNDPKKNSLASSSLLSTAVPITQENPANQVASSSISSGAIGGNTILNQANFASAMTSSAVGGPAKEITPNHPQLNPAVNTQITAPPLVNPTQVVTTISPSNSTVKPTAKPKVAAKGSRRKPAEINEVPKPEPKSKPSRSKKAAASSSEIASPPKPEPKRGKGKQPPKSAVAQEPATISSPVPKTPVATPTKRKSRSASLESNPARATPAPALPPAKRQRKKKTDPVVKPTDQHPNASSVPSSLGISTSSTQLQLNTAPNTLIGAGPLMINTPVINNRMLPGMTSGSGDGQDTGNRYFSPLPSPYTNFDQLLAPRSSLSRLFTASSASNSLGNPADDPTKAFEELRENTWTHLSRCVLEQAQQFDIPSLIGTLYTIRTENEKLVNKVRDLSMKRDQLIAMNARLDLPGPMLTQHLNNTSPNFASLVSGLTSSPKSLPTSSPGSAIVKQPLVSVGSFNHVPPGSLGPPGFLDRSSPLVGQTHSGINNIKSSSISTPSPPIGALMAHSNSNRTGLITVNPPYIPNVFPTINTMAQLGANPQGSSYYPRQ